MSRVQCGRQRLNSATQRPWSHLKVFLPFPRQDTMKPVRHARNVIMVLASHATSAELLVSTHDKSSSTALRAVICLVHVECAHQQGYILGFDIAPVKGSRRDQFNIVNINGEAGAMTAAIWCKEHVPTKTIVHRMHDVVDETGLNALQLYVQNFKQADLTLTGTVRKATLINQSTKIVNAVPVAAAPNRRTSTATVISNVGRASVSNVKGDEVLGSTGPDQLANPTSTADDPQKCITCGVDVSPKWWPYSAVSIGSSSSAPRSGVLSLLLSDTHPKLGDSKVSSQFMPHTLMNGQSGQPHVQESPKRHVALAAAALEEKDQNARVGIWERQCHKCHYRGVLKPSPMPPQTAAVSQQEGSLSQPLPFTRGVTAPALASPLPLQVTPHYSWPAQQAYSPPRPHGDWSRPAPAPSQPMTTVHQFNDGRSPHSIGNPHHMGAHSQVRQPIVPIPVSPHVNGGIGHQITTSYQASPHQGIGGTHQLQNGAYMSYASTRPSPQHLTNGGPPLRAPENPFAQSSPSIQHHPSYGNSHRSPSLPRETLPAHRERGPGARAGDSRVNGGASASPSLQNLLS
jgi:hypothetical protein